jgi:hypothetical protein
MKKPTILLLFLLSFLGLSAQTGQYALGLRAGISAGISAKWYAKPGVDFEALFTARNRGAQLTGLVEFSQPISATNDQWSWYYGLGAHVGFYQLYVSELNDPGELPVGRTTVGRLAMGPDAIVGIEFKPRAVPFSFSIDYKPYLDVLYWKRFYRNLLDASFSIRYVF